MIMIMALILLLFEKQDWGSNCIYHKV